MVCSGPICFFVLGHLILYHQKQPSMGLPDKEYLKETVRFIFFNLTLLFIKELNILPGDI